MMSYLGMHAEDVSFTQGEPRVFRSSGDGERGFCPECGTNLFFQRPSTPAVRAITTGTLDQPDLFEPALHIWTRHAVGWLHLPEPVPTRPEAP
jgi:hypothetical protein